MDKDMVSFHQQMAVFCHHFQNLFGKMYFKCIVITLFLSKSAEK